MLPYKCGRDLKTLENLCTRVTGTEIINSTKMTRLACDNLWFMNSKKKRILYSKCVYSGWENFMGSLFLTKNPARSWNHLGSQERHPNSYMSHIILGMQIGVGVLKTVVFYVLRVCCLSRLLVLQYALPIQSLAMWNFIICEPI